MAASDPASPVAMSALVLETIWDAVILIDGTGIVRHANQAFERLLGWPRSALIGRNAMEMIHPADLFHVRSMFELEPSGAPGVPPVAFRVRRHDEAWVPVEATAGLLELDGSPAMAVSIRELGHRVGSDEIRLQHDGNCARERTQTM